MAVTLTPIPDIPMVRPGDDLAGLLIAACERNALAPADGDVVVVAQKIVSKAEGRYVVLAKVKPSPRAALGAAGLPALMDLRGRPDLFGHELRVTQTGFADEIASAASLIMGQADEGRPMVLVRGLNWSGAPSPAAALIRSAEEDLFR